MIFTQRQWNHWSQLEQQTQGVFTRSLLYPQTSGGCFSLSALKSRQKNYSKLNTLTKSTPMQSQGSKMPPALQSTEHQKENPGYNLSTAILLYKSMVHPHLEYACHIWFPHTTRNIQALESVQKFALRVITKHWAHSYCPLLLFWHL